MALQDLGLTDRQERVYRLLLAHPYVSLEELAADVDSAMDHVRGDLAVLVRLSLGRVDLDRPARVRLANPATAIPRLVEEVEDELLQRQRRVRDTRMLLENLPGELPAEDVIGVERIEDLELVRERLDELSFFTRTSVYAVQPGRSLSPDALQAAQPLDQRGLRRGLDMRIVYEQALLTDEASAEYLQQLATQGAHVRLAEGPVDRLVIMDESVAVVPLDPLGGARGALVVREPGLVAGMVRLFESTWRDAAGVPWPAERTAQDDAGISDEDRQILTLLATGCTDETAARQLAMSVRHLRRKVARLMERLAATSRFEAGAEAARRGWI